MKTSKIMIFQPAYSSSRSVVARTSPAFRAPVGPTLDRTPFHHRVHPHPHPHPHPHSLRLGQCRHANSPLCTSLGCGSPWRKPTQTSENVPTLHRQWPWSRINFFPHQHINKITLNEMTLFEVLP